MANHIFTGSGVAIITPMKSDGSVNYDVLGQLLFHGFIHKDLIGCRQANLRLGFHLVCVFPSLFLTEIRGSDFVRNVKIISTAAHFDLLNQV